MSASLLPLSPSPRLIRLDTALPGVFEVERFAGREAVSEPFAFEADCLSGNAFVDLQALIGRAMTLRLRRADGLWRVWHGYCTQALNLGSDGGLARYRLRMEPWLAFLRQRRNLVIRQDMDERDVLKRLFAHYPQADYRLDVSRPLSRRPLRTQYETDFDYVTRLLAEAGLTYFFEHADGPARHTLVITDASAARPTATPAAMRFHRADATDTGDGLVQFSEWHQLVPAAVTVASWQPEQLRAVSAQAVSTSSSSSSPSPSSPSSSPSPLAGLEVYQSARSGVFPTAAEAQQAATQRLQGLRVPARLYHGAGNTRGMAAGFVFELTQHPALSGRFVPLAVEHEAANNLGSQAVRLLDAPELEAGRYANRFVCVPESVPLAPAFVPRPTAPGPQTAKVVGVPGQAVTGNRDHQVRVQFWWQRGVAPLRGGLTDTGSSADPGHAPGDASSGFWVPVLERVSGPDFGSHFLPRVGSEVVIDFAYGDIDQPLVIRQIYNGEDLAPYAAGVDGQANHPGVISGLQTQGLDGEGRQRWIIDDAPGQLRQQLDTSLAASGLALGALIDQPDANRGAWRGEGIELRTEGWSIQRAGEGLLISSSARPQAASTQMDAREAVAQARGAANTAKSLSEAAGKLNGLPLNANADQQALLDALDPQKQGHYSGSLNGQSTQKPKGEERSGGDPVERFARPLIVQEGPSHLAWTTSGSALLYAGQSQHWTTQQDAHLAAGATFAAVAGAQAGLLALSGPAQVIAAHGPVSLQAHTDTLEILADQSVTITSTDDTIDIAAQKTIVLQAGQSRVILDGENITFACPGKFTVKASAKVFTGGENYSKGIMPLPGLLSEHPLLNNPPHFDFKLTDNPGPQGMTLGNTHWRIVLAADEHDALAHPEPLLTGTSDAQGKLVLTPDEEKKLAKAHVSGEKVWVLYEGQIRQLTVAQEDEGWTERQKQEHALSALGYANNLGHATENDSGQYAAQSARDKLGASVGDIHDKFKKGV